MSETPNLFLLRIGLLEYVLSNVAIALPAGLLATLLALRLRRGWFSDIAALVVLPVGVLSLAAITVGVIKAGSLLDFFLMLRNNPHVDALVLLGWGLERGLPGIALGLISYFPTRIPVWFLRPGMPPRPWHASIYPSAMVAAAWLVWAACVTYLDPTNHLSYVILGDWVAEPFPAVAPWGAIMMFLLGPPALLATVVISYGLARRGAPPGETPEVAARGRDGSEL